MLSGEFLRKIKKLNNQLNIFCKDDDTKPAGLFHVVNGEFTEICGVDKNWIPERTIFNSNGTIFKSGWRRTLKILITKRLIDRWEAEKVFNTHLAYSSKKVRRPDLRPKRSLIEKYSLGGVKH